MEPNGRPGLLALVWGMILLCTACSEPDLAFVPWPTSVLVEGGELTLDADTRIVPSQSALEPLGPILAEEIRLATGIELETDVLDVLPEEEGIDAGGGAGLSAGNLPPTGSGDILLQLDPELAEEEYSITVDSVVRIAGGSYGGVAMGTTTLLQAIRGTTSGPALPRFTVRDLPRSRYRGLMVDLARQWHSIETLKQIIVMCRLYKVRYLHLHLTDNQSFTFPSRAYPELATPGRSYAWKELEELEAFASTRGVTLIPEIDIPGHSYAMISARPDIFGISRLGENPYVVNMGRDEAYAALDAIIGELAAVFRSSPFIHIGGDETWLAYLDEDPDAVAYMRRNGIPNTEELYRHFITRMNESVRRHGKRTIVWEGFGEEGEIEIPKDVLVMAWETAYQLPQDLLGSGYTIINVSWKPLYVVRNRRWSPEYIYGWNMYRWENWYRPTPSFLPIQLDPHEQVMGAQMAAWEQAEVMEVPSLRTRLPALSERMWNPGIDRGFADFHRRWAITDRLLQHLIRPAVVELTGQKYPGYVGPFFNRENWFQDTLTVEVLPLRDEYRVFFSNDPGPPAPNPSPGVTDEWTRYSGPLHLAESTPLRLRVEDGKGKSVGFSWRTDFEFRPLSLEAEGLADLPLVDPAAEPGVFHGELTVTLHSSRTGGTIRYTLDGEPPAMDSPRYRDPIVVSETSVLTAQLMDNAGVPFGEPLTRRFRKVEFTENLTTGKPVTTSQGQGPNPAAALAVDGMVDRDAYWGMDAGGAHPWLEIDLGESRRLTAAELVTYWDGGRYYRYSIDVSVDGQTWTQVVDASENATPATEAGYRHEFHETEGRYVRVTLLENSANSWVHVVEVRVY